MASCSLVLLVMVVLADVPRILTFNCVAPTKIPNAPPIPDMADSYQAHIELNILDKNKTWAVEEYMDFEGNRAARIVSEENEITKYVYSFYTDEIFVLKDETCKVVNMSSPAGEKLMVGSGSKAIPNDGDRRRIVGSSSVFKYIPKSSDLYAGKDTVRGIKADKWTSCKDFGSTQIRIDYYFSEPGWTMPLNIPLPLRIEVEGNIPNRGGASGTHYFHHIYEFISYRPDIETKSTMFETPTDVVCVGRESTKPLPVFDNRFQYLAENVDPLRLGITHFSVWYDGLSNLVRIDKRDTLPLPPVYTTNPVTEIHDHNSGIRYIKDMQLGNCSIHPLVGQTPDSAIDPQKTIEMSDPNRFFTFTKNYSYAGMRSVRGIECDVYSAVIHNYSTNGITTNALFHYYFIADSWQDQPLQGPPTDDKKYPIYLEVELPGYISLGRETSFFDFDNLAPNADVFDVSDCFDAKNKIDFKVIFPGTYNVATEDEWKYYALFSLADTMKMPPIRIGNIELHANLNNIYLTGTLLGTSSAAQFQHINKNSPERNLDKTFFNVKLPEQCAHLCVKNKGFLCQGFQYCPDDGFACGLSMYHVLNQTMKSSGKTCDFFTRTVPNYPYPDEPTVSEAYDRLAKAVQHKQFQIEITKPDGFAPNYVAIGIQKLSGDASIDKPIPSMASQFSYRMETVIPQFTTAFDSYVWYNSDIKFVRLDTRNANTPNTPEFSNIYDFNLGICYKINKVTRECEISPISATDDFDVNSFASKTDKNGGLQIKMKTPLEIFFIDSTYTFIGQKTVRGITCDAYQSLRSDFHIMSLGKRTESSLFTIYFQAEPWNYYTADSLDVSTLQPIQVTIEDKTAELMMIYNVFDFDDEVHSYDHYDVSDCFTSDQTKSFEIIFKNQPFHPFLDDAEMTFKIGANLRMGEATGTSPLRFQKISVNNDESDVFVMATVLGNVPAYTLFQPTKNVTVTSTSQAISVSSYKDCAASCVDIQPKPCNSFDYCPGGNSPTCFLRTLEDEFSTQGKVEPNGTCIHYARSEPGGYPIQSVDMMYKSITDLVYDNLFSITIYQKNGGNKTYLATDIRDDILLPTDPASAAGCLLGEFSKTVSKKLPDNVIVETHTMVSVTDCATSCVTTTAFRCQSFDYNYGVGACRLSDKHSDEITTQLSYAKNVVIYTSFYTKDYKHFGTLISNNPDKVISQVTSSELCARDWTEESSFNCESFTYCPDQKTCNLKKDHILAQAGSQQTGQSTFCDYYSRIHLFDYTKHSNHFIVGHDDLVTTVKSDSDCANSCARGELKGCASFEVCQVSRGDTECRLSLADPNLQNSSLTMETSRECNLFTRTKRIKVTNVVNTQAHTSSKSDTDHSIHVQFGLVRISDERRLSPDNQSKQH